MHVEGTSSEQYLELPRAIFDETGLPDKGSKSTACDFIEARYTTITTPCLPVGWNTECVLIDARFWLHAPPKKGSTMAQHALTLFQSKLFRYIQRGSSKVHIVFDMPMGFTNHPKSVEHKHRYSSGYQSDTHIQSSDEMKCPKEWSMLVQCWQCKHNLSSYIDL